MTLLHITMPPSTPPNAADSLLSYLLYRTPTLQQLRRHAPVISISVTNHRAKTTPAIIAISNQQGRTLLTVTNESKPRCRQVGANPQYFAYNTTEATPLRDCA